MITDRRTDAAETGVGCVFVAVWLLATLLMLAILTGLAVALWRWLL